MVIHQNVTFLLSLSSVILNFFFYTFLYVLNLKGAGIIHFLIGEKIPITITRGKEEPQFSLRKRRIHAMKWDLLTHQAPAKDSGRCQHQLLVAKGQPPQGAATSAWAPGFTGNAEAGAFPEDRSQSPRHPTQESWRLRKEREEQGWRMGAEDKESQRQQGDYFFLSCDC